MHLRITLTLLALLCAACSPSRPNVILIVIDTLRADYTLAIEGQAKTPAIESLAIDGVRFEHAFSHAPSTLPAHAALFASRLPHECGVRGNGDTLDDKLPLLADWLTRHGYASVGAVSLATMWPHGAKQDLARGFARYDFDLARECESADVMKERFDAVLAARPKDKPFFLFAHLSDPHEPYSALGTAHSTASVKLDGKTLSEINISEYSPLALPQVNLHGGENVLEITSESRFKLRKLELVGPSGPIEVHWPDGEPHGAVASARAVLTVPPGPMLNCRLRLWVQEALTPEQARERYKLEVEHCDSVLNDFLEELRRNGLYQKSWIVLTSDHGEALGEHDIVGHVVNLYDEMLHVPLIIKAPARDSAAIKLGLERDALVRHIDVVPTLLEALDLPPLPGETGQSLLTHTKRVLTAETYRPLAPLDLLCMRDDELKLIYTPSTQRFELYDLAHDPGELHDVFAARGAERVAWQHQLREIAATTPALDATPRAQPPSALHALGY